MSNKKVMIGFKTDPEVKEKLETIANDEDRSVSYIVNRIVTRELTESEKALVVMDYIDNMEFSSYGEFVKKAMKDKKWQWIKKDLGELQAYLIVCDILGVKADPKIYETLES